MCGIVGILGSHEVAPLLVESLKRLEYRGYDSAGIATAERGIFHIHKTRGQVREGFRTRDMRALLGTMGLGHVRYATKGAAVGAAVGTAVGEAEGAWALGADVAVPDGAGAAVGASGLVDAPAVAPSVRPSVPASAMPPIASTATSSEVRTSRSDRPVRWARPVIRPSRGPGPSCAPM